MTSRLTRLALALLLSMMSILVGAPPHAGAVIGPYTLPFFYPYSVTQDYLNGTHSGIDYNLPIGAWVASSDNGTADAYQEWVPNGGSDQDGGGNYFFLKHGTNLYSLYYHLKYNGVIYNGCCTGISEGQLIAYSGDTGLGPAHLHYQLNTTNVIGCPLQDCDIDPRQWTTSPGRVPWRADYVSEASPSGYNVMQYSVWTTWVRFKNVGGRAWSRTDDANGKNKIYLAATTPPPSPNKNPFSTRVSSFYVSGDWQANWLPGIPDGTASIGVDATATFTFQLRASSAGTYNERFDMLANSNFWFDYWESGYFSGWYIPITVQHCC